MAQGSTQVALEGPAIDRCWHAGELLNWGGNRRSCSSFVRGSKQKASPLIEDAKQRSVGLTKLHCVLVFG
jgi:hypothetical protein